MKIFHVRLCVGCECVRTTAYRTNVTSVHGWPLINGEIDITHSHKKIDDIPLTQVDILSSRQ